VEVSRGDISKHWCLVFDDNTDVWLNPMSPQGSLEVCSVEEVSRVCLVEEVSRVCLVEEVSRGFFSERGLQGSVEVLVESC